MTTTNSPFAIARVASSIVSNLNGDGGVRSALDCRVGNDISVGMSVVREAMPCYESIVLFTVYCSLYLPTSEIAFSATATILGCIR